MWMGASMSELNVSGTCSKKIQFGVMSAADIIKNGELQTFETKLYEVGMQERTYIAHGQSHQ